MGDTGDRAFLVQPPDPAPDQIPGFLDHPTVRHVVFDQPALPVQMIGQSAPGMDIDGLADPARFAPFNGFHGQINLWPPPGEFFGRTQNFGHFGDPGGE